MLNMKREVYTNVEMEEIISTITSEQGHYTDVGARNVMDLREKLDYHENLVKYELGLLLRPGLQRNVL
jgi:hypothetical protein